MAWHKRIIIVQIVVSNALPVIGVWFIGWHASGPIFFYWLDGLLALWGLGVVAAVVTSREEQTRGSILKRWLILVGVLVLIVVILSLPSAFTALYVLKSLDRGAGEFLRKLFTGFSIWFTLLVVIWSYTWQTISELLHEPSLTIKQTGQERANLFIHRTLLMGFLVVWDGWSQPTRWMLRAYVLAAACLYTYAELNPEGYLRIIGFKKNKI
ncbi:MAG TPA: hypothetical protein DDY20_01610 [Desulfobulbaceae bacterium]|nr:hypothetical protein [Desulfobulbaceae bacterium]